MPRDRQWTLFLAAVQLLTRVPVTVAHGPDTARRAVRYMPLVGLGIGAVAAAACLAARTGLPPVVAALLAVAATAALTGALHEDGLADCCDAVFARTRADALRIMRDSRLGTFGALGLGLVTATRVAAIAALADPAPVLLAAGACSRFWAVLPPAALPYARPDDTGKGAGAAVAAPARADLVLAGLFGLLPLLLLGGRAVPALLASGLAAAAVSGWAARRLGGYTGDVLGAVQQLAEAAVLVAALWHPGWGPAWPAG